MITQIKNNWLLFKQNKLCILCQLNPANETQLCHACSNDLPWIHHACQSCGIPLNIHDPARLTCPSCQNKQPSFEQAISPFEYRFPIDQLIQLAKFGHQSHYLIPLAELLSAYLLNHHLATPLPALIIPVPMHRTRLLERQYNQAALLGRQVAKRLQIRFDTTLIMKTTNTPHQADLDRKARQKNLRNSFQCLQKPPASVAVIDDVMTTGTTAAEISKVLKRAGCKKVYIWTIAHTAKQLHLR